MEERKSNDPLYGELDAAWAAAKAAHKAEVEARRAARHLAKTGSTLSAVEREKERRRLMREAKRKEYEQALEEGRDPGKMPYRDRTAGNRNKGMTQAEIRARYQRLAEELRRHTDEIGYGFEVARRENIGVWSLRDAMKRLGVPFGKMFYRKENFWEKKQNGLHKGDALEGKGAVQGPSCGVTGGHCPLARGCQLESRDGKILVLSSEDLSELCMTAIEHEEWGGCRDCVDADRCKEVWRCWRRASVSEDKLDAYFWARQRENDRKLEEVESPKVWRK